jgi:hypothetical protein
MIIVLVVAVPDNVSRGTGYAGVVEQDHYAS